MKKVYSLVLVLLFVICAFFTSCGGNIGLKVNPKEDATVYGNGGIVAIKENYLYFVNGYEDSSAFTSYKVNNVTGKVERGAIYRTELDKNGNVQHDEEGFLLNCDLVVSKTVGFSKGGFYIVGNYLYFLTPHMEEDSTGKLLNDQIDICKIDISGKGKYKRLYVAENASSKFDWSALIINGKTYITVLDGSKLVSINATDNTHETLIEEVSSVAFPKLSTLEYKDVESYNEYVYYTRATKTEDKLSSDFKGNIVGKINIADSKEKNEYIDNQNIYSVYEVTRYADGEIYYLKHDNRYSSLKLIYKRVVNSSGFDDATEIKLTETTFSDYVIANKTVENPSTTYIATVDANKVLRIVSQDGASTSQPVQTKVYTASNDINIIAIEESKVYFIESSKVYSINLLDGEQTPKLVSNSSKTYKTDSDALISVVGNKIFIMASYTGSESDSSSNYYLNVITTTKSDDNAQFLGKFAKGETPANPNEKLGEGEEPTLPWVK